MVVDVYDKQGQKSGQTELPDDIFGIEPNEHAMYQAVRVYLAHQRQGTHKVKTRTEVSGGGKKPWKQKGRGTARSGSSRSPVWVGGGTSHGPQPHLYTIDLPRKVKKLARKSALSLRLQEENLLVVDDFQLEGIKTRSVAEILKALNISSRKTLILLPNAEKNVIFSARNIAGVSTALADKISAYDILKNNKIVIYKSAIENLTKTFSD
jgi:large subunit ribosomal protein L4